MHAVLRIGGIQNTSGATTTTTTKNELWFITHTPNRQRASINWGWKWVWLMQWIGLCVCNARTGSWGSKCIERIIKSNVNCLSSRDYFSIFLLVTQMVLHTPYISSSVRCYSLLFLPPATSSSLPHSESETHLLILCVNVFFSSPILFVLYLFRCNNNFIGQESMLRLGHVDSH